MIYNIGNGSPVGLRDFVEALETELGKKASYNMMPMQPGDVPSTWADTTDLERDINFRPGISVNEGIRRFVAWYREFYGV
jgi:UDP-glucuronate 4-epimerase